jgi:hypothetical protein
MYFYEKVKLKAVYRSRDARSTTNALRPVWMMKLRRGKQEGIQIGDVENRVGTTVDESKCGYRKNGQRG